MRSGKIKRKTTETDVSVSLKLDGTGKYKVQTGIGFFDHMLEQLARHSLICLLYTSPSPRDKRQSRMPSSA